MEQVLQAGRDSCSMLSPTHRPIDWIYPPQLSTHFGSPSPGCRWSGANNSTVARQHCPSGNKGHTEPYAAVRDTQHDAGPASSSRRSASEQVATSQGPRSEAGLQRHRDRPDVTTMAGGNKKQEPALTRETQEPGRPQVAPWLI